MNTKKTSSKSAKLLIQRLRLSLLSSALVGASFVCVHAQELPELPPGLPELPALDMPDPDPVEPEVALPDIPNMNEVITSDGDIVPPAPPEDIALDEELPSLDAPELNFDEPMPVFDEPAEESLEEIAVPQTPSPEDEMALPEMPVIPEDENTTEQPAITLDTSFGEEEIESAVEEIAPPKLPNGDTQIETGMKELKLPDSFDAPIFGDIMSDVDSTEAAALAEIEELERLGEMSSEELSEMAARPEADDASQAEAQEQETTEDTSEVKKRTYRAKPKPRFNFKSQILPQEIYKPQYTRHNKHLPAKRTYETYDAHLFASAARDDLSGLRALLNVSAMHINQQDGQGNTPLIIAVRAGAINATRLLLSKKADPNRPNDQGLTPLHIAVSSGRIDIVKALLISGASPHMTDNQGNSPLNMARGYGFQRIATILQNG